jgi:hypothetical protein
VPPQAWRIGDNRGLPAKALAAFFRSIEIGRAHFIGFGQEAFFSRLGISSRILHTADNAAGYETPAPEGRNIPFYLSMRHRSLKTI